MFALALVLRLQEIDPSVYMVNIPTSMCVNFQCPVIFSKVKTERANMPANMSMRATLTLYRHRRCSMSSTLAELQQQLQCCVYVSAQDVFSHIIECGSPAF